MRTLRGIAAGRRQSLIGGAALAILQARGATAAPPVGSVDGLQGEGYAVAGTVQRPLLIASSVFVGDLVGTRPASTMSLRLGSATAVRLGPEAQLKIDRFILNVEGVLTLDRGGTLVDHDPTVMKNNLLLRSPFGLIAVRGTRFYAGPSAGVFGVFVERGAVMVVGRNTAVQLSAGFGTDISRPGAEPTDPKKWGDARIAAAMALVGAR